MTDKAQTIAAFLLAMVLYIAFAYAISALTISPLIEHLTGKDMDGYKWDVAILLLLFFPTYKPSSK